MNYKHIAKISLFIVLFFFYNFRNSFSQDKKDVITLEDIWTSRKFSSKPIPAMIPMNDGEHYAILKNTNSILSYKYSDGQLSKTIIKKENLIDSETKDTIAIEDFWFNHDESKILISASSELIYRYSTRSHYYIYDIGTNKLTKLTNDKARMATLSPSGLYAAYIRDNNLFIKNLSNGNETPVTSDGKVNSIINGASDWVYEEEFDLRNAYQWSPNGNKIAFYRFDESNVKEFDMTIYGKTYPEQFKYKYPKAGEDNSIIKILVYNIDSNKTSEMNIGTETNQYIPKIAWTKDNDMLAIIRMNRLQNNMNILIANTNNGSTNLIYTENNKCYVEVPTVFTFLDDKKHFIISSEIDGNNHLYLYTLQGKKSRQLTNGNFDVTALKGVDEKESIIYYVSTEETAINRTLYSIDFKGKIKKKLSMQTGFNSPEFSKGLKYFVNRFSDGNSPVYCTVSDNSGKTLWVVEDNKNLREIIKQYNFGFKEYITIKTADNVQLNGWMIKPANFDPYKKYPVLIYVYGGPGSQTVMNAWGREDNLWYQMLSQKGYIIVSFDNRGTPNKGEEFKKSTYLNLGKYETIDQTSVAKYLATLPYIDKTRIGIWGWSYGGFMTLLCMTKSADIFKMGIAVAPVTNWKYYDNIYTERFMRTPKENSKGYEENSPINFADKLKGSLLMIHGTADDNVHFQNTVDMNDALIKANKKFDIKFYPNKNHSITGATTRLHLYTTMTDFILKNL